MTERLRVGLVVDVGKRQLLLRGQPLQVHLSPQEFDLLHLLWEKAGQVCTSDEVYDRLWPDEGSHSGRQQDIHQVVRHVRRKLEPHVGSGVIENVPSIGYRLGLEVREEEEEELPAVRRVGNLPVELTSFVGRADEIRTAEKLLSAARLLTLTGIGGAGKTRLALKVAEEQQEYYPDGVWLVELASLSESSLVDKEITSVIGSFDEESLADKRMLLILDNCEHLVDSCAQAAFKVLQQAPLSRILATSREPLGVPGEIIHRVPPLSIPPSTDLSPNSLSAYEAVSLFVDRARSAEPNFALTEVTGPSVSQISRRLDGIPLAIELAAARVNVLSVDEIANRLDDMFRLLIGKNRTALAQHRTLQAAIDWSYRLLSRPEQLLFSRLSVFRGGFTIEAAGRMVTAGEDQNQEVLGLLTQLVSKSIVTVEQKEGRPTRYRLLETLQQYAWDRLQESDEVTEMRDRHTRFFLDVAQSVEAKLRSTGSADSLTILKDDQDNLRAAWDWARESNNPEFVESEAMGSLTSMVLSF